MLKIKSNKIYDRSNMYRRPAWLNCCDTHKEFFFIGSVVNTHDLFGIYRKKNIPQQYHNHGVKTSYQINEVKSNFGQFFMVIFIGQPK